MEKKEAVRKALESGFLLSPEALEEAGESGIEPVLERGRGKGGIVIGTAPKPGPGKMYFEVSGPPKTERVSAQDFVEYYKNKYEIIKNLLTEKGEAVSINKASELPSSYIIGMVKEITPTGFIVEDPTGKVEARTKDDSVKVDDVVGLKGGARENVFLVHEVVWPDIPLKRTAASMGGANIILTRNTEGVGGALKSADLVILGVQERPAGLPENEKLAVALQNPARVTLRKDGKELVIFVYHNPNELTDDEAAAMLRKRHLSPKPSELHGPADQFIINPVPDILWIASNKENRTMNYKGVSIVSCADSAKINLGNREVEFPV